MKRILSLILGAALIAVLVCPVSVSAAENNLTELLEFSTVNYSGNNRFTFTNSTTIKVDVPMYTPLRYIDIVFLTEDSSAPSSVSVSYNGADTKLTIKPVSGNIYRAYGTINGIFEEVYLKFVASGTKNYTLLSCKVSPVTTSRASCSATFAVNVMGDNYNAVVGTPFEMNPAVSEVEPLPCWYQANVTVKDATDYDTVYVQFATNYASINSIRCTYGSTTVPFTWNYMDVESKQTFTQFYENIGRGYDLDTFGKVIGGITVDLSGIERNRNLYLTIYFNGDFNSDVGLYLNVSGVEGEVLFADTTDATWWNRFTSFMTDLFCSDNGQESLDDLQQSSSSISQGASDIHAFEQSQQAVLDSGMTTIQNAVSYTSFMAALVFVQKYANMTFDGISQYAIVFTLPLFLGLFFYLCSRIPGITRWKPRPPKSKGGDSP